MKKQIFQLKEHSYEPIKVGFEEKNIQFNGIESINMNDFICWSREELLFKKSGQLLEHRTYNGDYELSTMKLLIYDENDLLVKEINTCIIPDWNDIGTDYSEDSYVNGKKVKNFFHQADNERVNDGYIEYIYSNDYSKIIDASQPNSSYKKRCESNDVQVIEEWGNNGTEKVMIRGVLEEWNDKKEIVFRTAFDDQYNIPSQKDYKDYHANGYHIQEWTTGLQVNYSKYDINNNLVESKTSHKDSPNYNRELYRYNELNDETEFEVQSYCTEDVNGNKISDHPVNIYTYNGGNPNITRYYYLYDTEGNWITRVSVCNNKIHALSQREIKYF